MKRIVYPTEGGVAVIVPSTECGLTAEQIALKDVPAGVPFKIIDTINVPIDRTFRGAWEGDFTKPDGVGLGHDAWFAKK